MSSVSVTTNDPESLDAECAVDAPAKHSRCGAERRWPTQVVQQLVTNRLALLKNGQLFLDDQCGRCILGSNDTDDMSATVVVRDPDFYWSLAKGGNLGAADSYLNGDWECDDLVSLFRIFCRNIDQPEMNGFLKRLSKPILRAGHWFARNTREGSRRNIQAHYDLGNEFFELFLDPSMMYSAAVYETPETTLEEAQIARLDKVCQQLELKPTDHLVEIGTGWGGLAVYAAIHHGCKVTTTTISQNQYDYAVRRVADAGLSDQVTVLMQDYRDLTGTFDKLVSLEMIEAVGPQFHDTYFAKCADLLKRDGRMLLQAIVMPEQRYEQYLKSMDFIQKYIFPGGSLPSVAAMQNSVARTSQLRMLAMEDFADGYARTLREWRRRFHLQRDAVRALGYPERFIRMWDYYLAYCEAAFEERSVGVVHAVWGR
jgi:cyclopropane-fatty-acyl-phospholipid synthase